MTASSASTALAVRRVLADILGLPADSPALSDDANLFELGLDSLGVVRFLGDIETALSLRVPDDALSADLFERLDRLTACIEAQVTPMTVTLADLIGHSAAQRPDAPALRHAGRTLTYAELQAEVGVLARGWAALGVARGERIAVWADKRLDAVCALYAASAAAAVFVPVNPGLKPPQVAHIVADAGAVVLVTTAQRWALAAEALRACPTLVRVVLLEDAAASSTVSAPTTPAAEASSPAVIAWSTLCALGAALPDDAGRGDPSRTPIDGDVAALLYTSGSTGRPKGVVVSHRNLVEGARSVAAYLPLTPDDRVLAVLPLSFDYGLNQLSQCFLVGACAVLHNHLLARDVIEALQRERATGLAGVPPLWMQLAGLDWPAEVAATLRFITNSGGHMPRPVLDRLRQALPHTRPYLMYGLTEAFRSTWLPPEQLDVRPDSMGRAIPNAEILVLREDGSVCADDEPGELVHRGVHVSLGYWNDAARTAERFKPLPPRDGLPLAELAVWSGDLVRRDAEGYLYFIGRRDDTIKTSGYRVSPTEIEDVVLQVDGVAEAAAFGVPHPQWGHAIVVVLRRRDGSAVDAAAVAKACRVALASHMQPAHVELHDEDLPRNPNGKIDRPLLVSRHNDRFQPEGSS